MRMGRRSPRPNISHAKSWFSLLLIGLLCVYLLFVWYLERISLTTWLQQFALVALEPSGLLSFFGLIFRVLRHLIPVAVGWWFAYIAAVETIERLYDLPERESARRFLRRLRSPAARGRKAHSLNRVTLEAEREESVILRVGGPGKVSVTAGDVAVTEINGRFGRLLPPGVHLLNPYEYIHTVIDLRRQEREILGVPMRTKDNIDVTADLAIIYQIQPGEGQSTKERPYPYDETAVRIAAYAQTVLQDGTVSSWDNRPALSVRSKMTGVVAQYILDELMHPSGRTDEPYLTLQREVQRAARAELAGLGIDLISVAVHQIKPPPKVEAQYIKYWQAHWQSKAKLSEADGQAVAVEEIEVARAEAEVAMIQAILEGIQRARRSGATSHTSEIVALRLVEGLERMAEQSRRTRPLLPMLTQLQEELRTDTVFPSPRSTKGTEQS